MPSTIQVTKLMAPPQLQKRKILSNQTQPVKKVARVCSEEENKAKMMKQLNRVESEEILDVFSVPHDAVMYDPAKPNDYELFCLERQKHMDAEKRLQILKEEKLKLEEEAKKLEKISQDAKKTNELNATSVLLLLNMVPGREKIDDDLDKETAEECSKFGIVKECIVYPITNPNVPENEAVRIFVSFSDISSAINGICIWYILY